MNSSRFASAIKHPVWITIGTTVSAIALVLTGVNYFRSQESSGELEISAISIEAAAPIAAVGTVPAMGDEEPQEYPQDNETATPIDITVKNNGGDSVHINRITAALQDPVQFTCLGVGGTLAVTADYSLKLPSGWDTGAYLVKDGSASVDYTVKPKSSDRMVVSVGPDEAAKSPYVFFASLDLQTDDGTTATTKPLALVTSTNKIDSSLEALRESDDPRIGECVDHYLADVKTKTPEGAVRSPELDRWISGLAEFAEPSN